MLNGQGSSHLRRAVVVKNQIAGKYLCQRASEQESSQYTRPYQSKRFHRKVYSKGTSDGFRLLGREIREREKAGPR